MLWKDKKDDDFSRHRGWNEGETYPKFSLEHAGINY
jgi:hypothetical protein